MVISPLLELTFWLPGTNVSPAASTILADPGAPLSRHGLTGVVSTFANEQAIPVHPSHVHAAESIDRRCLAADAALTEVVPALSGAGVAFFVADGPAVARSDDRNPRLRPYGHLDIFLPTPDLPKAVASLATLGYRPTDSATRPWGEPPRELVGGAFAGQVRLRDHPVAGFQHRWLPPVEAFLEYRYSTELLGVEVPVLMEPAHVALRAMHLGADHLFQKLVLYRDLATTNCNFDVADAVDLGAGPYLAVIADVLSSFGHEVQCDAPRGVLHGRIVAALVSSDPQEWQRRRMSRLNMLAIGNQLTRRRALSALRAAASQR